MGSLNGLSPDLGWLSILIPLLPLPLLPYGAETRLPVVIVPELNYAICPFRIIRPIELAFLSDSCGLCRWIGYLKRNERENGRVYRGCQSGRNDGG